MTDTPGFVDGLKGPVLEPYYKLFGPALKCRDCEGVWRGYYAQHMTYCHFCGTELITNE